MKRSGMEEKMKLDETYRNKLYGGFLGKYIGVMHGAEIESWTYEQIRSVYGEITEYPVKFENFCSDDDLNGPLFYMRSLKDFGASRDITQEQMAQTLLNYAAERHGFFWWGGYGISTEETAYWNLVNGIKPPMSGSEKQNGKVIAEQIGGQIFSDCWGLLCPGDPDTAALLAGKMSGVTHGGNGIYGGQFIAACIAAAFTAETVEEILEAGLKQIPEKCEYSVMVREVMEKSRQNGEDFRKSFRFVQEKYGYQNYGGVCHIIPNAAVIILSLIHGRGRFSETLNICNMCGWDTDCNVGNVGTIMGVFTGAEAIPQQWTQGCNDFLCASGVLGCLNIQTLSQEALLASKLTHALYGIRPEGYLKELFAKKEGKHFHFEFPGALHGMRVRGTKKILLENVRGEAYRGERCLKVTAPYLQKGEAFQVYFKSYYVPEDFKDSRYDPDFSPIVYPGDQVRAMVKMGGGQVLCACPFIKDRITGEYKRLEDYAVNASVPGAACGRPAGEEGYVRLEFPIPSFDDMIIEETGWEFYCPAEKTREPYTVYIDDVEIIQKADYKISFAAVPVERWNVLHTCVAGMTWLRGKVEKERNCLAVSGFGAPAEAYTGETGWRNYTFRVRLIPGAGTEHRILFRVQGAMRCYAAGLTKDGGIGLFKKDGAYRLLCRSDFAWEEGQEYELTVQVQENRITVYADGKQYLSFEDHERPWQEGCIGFGNEGGARTWFKEFEVRSMPEGSGEQ